MSSPIVAALGAEVLFFDLAEMESLERVVLSVEQASKHPYNPVLPLGDMNAWDSAQASPWAMRTVLYDEQDKVFKCWYNGTDHAIRSGSHGGYAVSADGVCWEKPHLGIIEVDGSTRNNMFDPSPYGAIIKDLAEPDPAKRYKMMLTGLCRYSADGIHWDKGQRFTFAWHLAKPWDSVAFVRDEQDPDPSRRFKYVFQYYDRLLKPGPEQVRFKGLLVGPTELDWRPAPTQPMLGPNDGFEHENHFLMFIPYKGHYLALYECGWYHPDGTGKYGRYLADIRLAHSRDGEHFTRVNPHQPVIPIGAPGDWDGQFLVISDKAVIKDDTIYLYYCGQGEDWTSWPWQNVTPGDRTIDPATGKSGIGSIGLSRMGLATLRMDGFTSLHVADGVSFGQATTKAFRAEGAVRGLTVNLGCVRPRRHWLQVEVLDAETLAPIEGFTRADCAPLCTDGLRVPVRWNGRDLGAAGRRGFRLRFHFFGAARLYSFAFA